MTDSDNKVNIVKDEDGHTTDKDGNPIPPLVVPDSDHNDSPELQEVLDEEEDDNVGNK